MLWPGASTAFTPTLASRIIAFVVAAEAPTASHDDDFLFGDLEGLQGIEHLEDLPDNELVEEVVGEIQQIRGNSGVGSPEVRKYVDAWSPPVSPLDSKEAHLRVLAENLYQRRPVLYLKGHSQPYPAEVLLRTVRKPSASALTAAAGPAGLFKYPSNSFVVIKFDPKFGYADIIVDPFFTDAFIQQPSTATYSKLLSELPRAFVGTAPELRKLVALLTQQSIRAYAAKGATCPPWRRFDAMLARWLPKKFTDELITSSPLAGSSAHGGPAAAAQLLRFDSSSSTASTNSGFSLTSSSEVGSFSSSGSSIPRTIVHGFDIPAPPATADDTDRVAVAMAALPAAPARATPKAAYPAEFLFVEASAATEPAQQYDSLGLVIASKLAAVTAEDSADAASSWQLATELAVDDESDDVYSSSTGSTICAAAASYHSGVHMAGLVRSKSALTAVAAKVPLATLQQQVLSRCGSAAAAAAAQYTSDQLLAAAGYSTRTIRLVRPSADAAAAALAADTCLRRLPGCSISSATRAPRGDTTRCAMRNHAVTNVADSSAVVRGGSKPYTGLLAGQGIAQPSSLKGQRMENLAHVVARISDMVMRCHPVAV